MNEKTNTAAAGGIAGAVAALIAVWVGGALGLVPLATDARLHAYLMAHPGLVYEMAAKDQADEAAKAEANRQKAVDKLGVKAFFDPAVAFVTGPQNAKHTFVEFFDYNCIHCRNAFPAVKAFYEKHKNDTRFAFVEMPINGPASENAARVAIAARSQGDKYLALHFALMGEKEAIDNQLLYNDAAKTGLNMTKLIEDVAKPPVDKALAGAHKLAGDAGVSGTPTFIVNGRVYDGEVSEKEFERMIK
jgi:protein-disulfide isomerase